MHKIEYNSNNILDNSYLEYLFYFIFYNIEKKD
jgi:hypothetical protein